LEIWTASVSLLTTTTNTTTTTTIARISLLSIQTELNDDGTIPPTTTTTMVGVNLKAEAMVTPRHKCRRPAMVTPKSYPYP